MITEEEHKQIHVELHKALDRLLADFIGHTKEPFLDRPIKDLIDWSYKQTIKPD